MPPTENLQDSYDDSLPLDDGDIGVDVGDEPEYEQPELNLGSDDDTPEAEHETPAEEPVDEDAEFFRSARPETPASPAAIAFREEVSDEEVDSFLETIPDTSDPRAWMRAVIVAAKQEAVQAVRAEMQAVNQFSREARNAGFTDAFLDEFGAELEMVKNMVPAHLRATKEGAQMLSTAAISARIQQGVPPAKAFALAARLMVGEQAQAPARASTPPPPSTPSPSVQGGSRARSRDAVADIGKFYGLDTEDIDALVARRRR